MLILIAMTPIMSYIAVRAAIKCGVVVDDGVPF